MGSDILLAAATPPAATATPVPPSPSHVALDVGLSLVILALTIVLLSLLGFAAWALFVWSQKKANGKKWVPTLTDGQIRAIQGNGVLGVLLLLLVLGVVWLPLDPALQAGGVWITGEFIAVGVMLSAGFFGFLFGLPHYVDPAATGTPASGTPATGTPGGGAASRPATAGPSFLPSTNLEKVADNVATLVAGAALAQLVTIPSYVGRFATFFATNLGLNDAGKPLGAGILLFYAPLGFVLAYVTTRTIGARAFASSDAALLRTGSKVVAELPVLPDVPADATPEQRAVAARIAAVSLSTLESVGDRTTWARAQSILENWKAAETAYQQVLVIDSTNAELTLEYATVLYNDEAFVEYRYILQLIDTVLKLLDADDDAELRSQALSLRAGTNLYVPGGSYIKSIVTVNDVLRNSKLQAGKTLRFYRACAFGQLYRGYLAHDRLKAGDPAARAIAALVERDAAITLTLDDDLKSQLQAVIDPARRKELGYSAYDDDLQQLAIDDAALATMCGVTSTIPAPDPATTPDPLDLPAGIASVEAFVASCPM